MNDLDDARFAALPATMTEHLRTALDPDVEASRRIAHLSRAVRKVTPEARAPLARLLVRALREPTLWLGLEVRQTIADLQPDIAFGVDAHGLLRCSDEPWSSLVADGDGQRHDGDGPVVDIARLEQLRPQLADQLPWLDGPGPVAQAPLVLSYFLGSREPLRIERPARVTFGALDLRDGGGFARAALARGELAHVAGGRLVNLGGGQLGVHDVLTSRVVVVDDGAVHGLSAVDGSRTHARFARFRLELHGQVFRIVDGKFLR
jgi:hypothetical protein